MPPRIVIIGGGSYQWVPKLLIDLANTPSLQDAEIVLEDVNPEPLPLMSRWVERIASLRDIGLSVTSTTDQRPALEGADFVVVSISTGGFTSMRHDLEIPERYGIRQSVGDTVGPGGISRTLRNVPVLVGIARDMQEICPDAWLLNLTNPMTALCRAITRETPIKTIGLCHELTMTRFTLSLLLDADFRSINLEVTGVNHLPVITAFDIEGRDGFDALRDLVADPARRRTARVRPPRGLRHAERRTGRAVDARRPARRTTSSSSSCSTASACCPPRATVTWPSSSPASSPSSRAGETAGA